MLKTFKVVLFSLLFATSAIAQLSTPPAGFNFEKAELQSHLMYLASDELAGRRATSQGERLAAEYIAGEFEAYGVKQVPGQENFFQPLPFDEVIPAKSGSLKIGNSEFELGDNLLILKGGAMETTAESVFAGHGWFDEEAGIDDYKNLDVKGKIVFVLPGKPDSKNPMEVFKAMKIKQQLAAERGAIALIELYRLSVPWQFFKQYFGNERLELADNNSNEAGTPSLLYGWIQEGSPSPVPDLEKNPGMQATLTTSGLESRRLNAVNVVGIIEGTDEILKNEYVLLSAHYDHVGVGKEGGAAYTEQDSIFNGARDNGMGTVALLATAKELAANPPKRSIILLACTAEEMGLLGSAWYVDHPLVPLEKTVFNLNNDGAGYNSTEHITVIGLERTSVDEELHAAATSTGLKITGDPAPGQNLYERSDNFSFARKGVPAIDIAPGITEMNEEVFQYYHQAADNPDSIDYDYLLKFCQAYTAMARMIADKPQTPAWTPGDEFEKK